MAHDDLSFIRGESVVPPYRCPLPFKFEIKFPSPGNLISSPSSATAAGRESRRDQERGAGHLTGAEIGRPTPLAPRTHMEGSRLELE